MASLVVPTVTTLQLAIALCAVFVLAGLLIARCDRKDDQ